MRARAVAACALAATVALIPLVAPTPASAQAEPEFFGISAPELYSMSLDGRHALRDAALEEIEAAGIDAVRTEIGWRDVERHAPALGVHDYRWGQVDGHVFALARRSQRLMPMLMAPPAWAQPPESAAACDRHGMVARGHVADYARYAAEVARRYGRGGHFWRAAAHHLPALPQRPITTYELWNEPNWDVFSCPAIDPEVYAEAVAVAADAIHAVDPQATVTIGGLVVLERDRVLGQRLVGMRTARFLERMMTAVPSLAARVDAVALHTYWATPAANLRAIALAEGWLDAAGLGGERLIVSEFGWTAVGADAVTEEAKTQMVEAYADSLAGIDCRVDAAFAHSWVTPRQNRLDPEDWFGLADPATGAALASGQAYARAIAANPSAGSAGCDRTPRIRVAGRWRRTSDRRPTIRFRVRGADPGIRVAARLDGRRERRVSSPLRLPPLGLGPHVLRLRARDDGVVVAKRKLRFRVVVRSG